MNIVDVGELRAAIQQQYQKCQQLHMFIQQKLISQPIINNKWSTSKWSKAAKHQQPKNQQLQSNTIEHTLGAIADAIQKQIIIPQSMPHLFQVKQIKTPLILAPQPSLSNLLNYLQGTTKYQLIHLQPFQPGVQKLISLITNKEEIIVVFYKNNKKNLTRICSVIDQLNHRSVILVAVWSKDVIEIGSQHLAGYQQ